MRKAKPLSWRRMVVFVGLSLAVGTVLTVTRAAAPYPGGTPPAKLLFGLGPEADGAKTAALAGQAPVKMLTSWYNGPGDLAWMTGWKNNLVPQDYASGYALHLIVYTSDPEQNIATNYGTACGRPYPLSAGFAGDMKQLAQTFNGSGPLYVTLFTEFQTYACTDNQWAGQENYYNALKDQYRAARAVFRQYAPNSRVSIGWGGWQTRWDNPATGAGRSMIGHFADIMGESEFQSFQAMQSDTNVDDMKNMTSALSPYGPVMVAHFKPDNGSQTTFNADVAAIFSDSFISDITKRGLFALSFMDTINVNGDFTAVKDGVTKYASSSLLPYTAPAGGATGGTAGKAGAVSKAGPAASASLAPAASPSATKSAAAASASPLAISGKQSVATTQAQPKAPLGPVAAVAVAILIGGLGAGAWWLRRRKVY